MSSKLLKQDIESRDRTERLVDMVEQKYGVSITLKEAESLLTKAGMEVANEQGLENILDN